MQKTISWNSVPSLATSSAARSLALVVGASFFMAACARLSFPLPFTPIPLTLGNFAVLLIGLVLGSRRGMAALALYLLEGIGGLPVFSPAGPGGLAQLMGPSGGYLLAYPAAAFVAGWVAERSRRGFRHLLVASIAGDAVLFAGGIAWLMLAARAPLAQAIFFGLYPFFFAEVMKVVMAAGIAGRLNFVDRN